MTLAAEIEKRLDAVTPQLAENLAEWLAPVIAPTALASWESAEILSCKEAAEIYGVKERRMAGICAKCARDCAPIGFLMGNKWIVSRQLLMALIGLRKTAFSRHRAEMIAEKIARGRTPPDSKGPILGGPPVFPCASAQ